MTGIRKADGHGSAAVAVMTIARTVAQSISPALALAATLSLAPALASADTVAIHCGRLIDGLASEAREHQTVLVVDGRIQAVGSAVAVPAGARTLDLSAQTCLPGLLDLHTHITDIPQNTADFTVYPRLSPEEHLAIGRPNGLATLEAGFTTVRDVGTYIAGLDREMRDEIDSGKLPGPRMQVSITYLTVPGGGGDMLLPGFPKAKAKTPLARLRRGVARGPEEFRAKAEQLVADGATVLKCIASGAVLALGGIPGAPEMTPEELRAVAEVAHKHGLKLAAHAHGARSVKEAILAGADTIEHASLIDEEGILLAKEHGVALSMDVYNGDYIDTEGRKQGWPAEFLQKNIDTTEAQRQAFTRAVQLGATIVFATDASVYPNGLNARQFRIMVQRGMSPMQAIQSATSVAAKAMGWDDRVGALVPGRYGDLVAVAGDPLADITVLESPVAVVKGGEVVKAPQTPGGRDAPPPLPATPPKG